MIEVTEYDPITHQDNLVLPALNEHNIVFGSQLTGAAPRNVTIGVDVRVHPDGTTAIVLVLRWADFNPVGAYSTIFRARLKDDRDVIGGANDPAVAAEDSDKWFNFSTDEDPPWRIGLNETTLAPEDVIVWQVRHATPDGSVSDWTPLAELTLTGDSDAPADPANVTATGLPAAYKVEWDYPTEGDYSYTRITHRRVGGSSEFEKVGDIKGSSHIEVVEGEETYEIRLVHYDTSDNPSGEATVSVTTLAGTTGDTILDVRRDPVTGEVTIIVADQDWVCLVEDTGNANRTYSDTGLQPDTLRSYRVSAINDAGTGPPSNVEDAET